MVKPGYPGCSCDFSEGWESGWDGVGWGGGVGCWFPIHALVSRSPPAGFRFEPRVSDSVFLWFPIRFPLVSDSVSTGFRFAAWFPIRFFLVSDSGFLIRSSTSAAAALSVLSAGHVGLIGPNFVPSAFG